MARHRWVIIINFHIKYKHSNETQLHSQISRVIKSAIFTFTCAFNARVVVVSSLVSERKRAFFQEIRMQTNCLLIMQLNCDKHLSLSILRTPNKQQQYIEVIIMSIFLRKHLRDLSVLSIFNGKVDKFSSQHSSNDLFMESVQMTFSTVCIEPRESKLWARGSGHSLSL